MRSVKVYQEAWPLHSPFVIARGSRSEAVVVVVELEEEGVRAVGECTPYPRYGESVASVMAQIMTVVPQLETGLDRAALQRLLPAGAARNAIDCALWDLDARRAGETLEAHLQVTLPDLHTTAQTVVIGAPEQMAVNAALLWEKGARLLKIKLDDTFITERMVAIREAVPEATLIVDANESWHAEGLAARCQLLADLGVQMLEQPLPASDDRALENFIHPLPICADESCHARGSLKTLAGRYEMINIKLDKTGGLTERWRWRVRRRTTGLASCWAVCSAPRAPSAPRCRFSRRRALPISTAPPGLRWMSSPPYASRPVSFISTPTRRLRFHRRNAAARSLPPDNAR